MKDTYIDRLGYYIKPRMKKRWFRSDIKVYDLIEKSEGEYWSNPSYGNGGGNFVPFDKEEVLYSFERFAEADKMKEELENIKL